MSDFEILPVIDLMGGQVVHARAGERDRYRPLDGSVLCKSALPLAVVEGLLDLHPFNSIYIADLDAIRKQGHHRDVVRSLQARFPGLELWVDAGFDDPRPCRRFLDDGPGRLVLGSESQTDLRLGEELRSEPRLALSLDFKGALRLGPPALFERPELWPRHLIVMTLARVGGGSGPDHERLRLIRALAPACRVYAAGGVRGVEDLLALAADGVAGALVASALHDGRLDRGGLRRLG
jgi:phosphoribosylformimino-5-aminoimidazole carboxamide ribotide isomerase